MPAVAPVTIPVTSIGATTVLLLDHVPPGEASFNVVVAPAHKTVVPVIGNTVALLTKLIRQSNNKRDNFFIIVDLYVKNCVRFSY